MYQDNTMKYVVGGIAAFVILIIVFASLPFTLIGAGERGVIFNNTSGVEQRILGEGLHFIVPFLQSVRKVDIRVQRDEAMATAGTNDLQTVTLNTVVNWRVDPEKVNLIYQQIGGTDDVLDKIIRPRVLEIVKSATSQYSAEETLTKRSDLKFAIDSRLKEDLIKYNIVVDDVAISDIKFSPEFDQAVEAKVLAEQNALQEKNKLESSKYQAQQQIEAAKAEAESIKIRTEALSQNQNLIELTKAEALKVSAEKGVKIVPDTVIGEGSLLYSLK